jgi:integrase
VSSRPPTGEYGKSRGEGRAGDGYGASGSLSSSRAVGDLAGHARRRLAIYLRSLFRALKRERVIFRNPARNLPVGDLKGMPQSVPSDKLAGLLGQASTPLGRLAIALIAVHAVPAGDIRALLTRDVNLARGTLEIRRGLLRHTVYLEELTHHLAAEWLAYRHRRWPASANPHLLVSQKSALDPDHPAVSIELFRGALPKGVTLEGLRQDRILNEAFETADPLKLMRLFGITEGTAMHYVTAAHPERTARLLR